MKLTSSCLTLSMSIVSVDLALVGCTSSSPKLIADNGDSGLVSPTDAGKDEVVGTFFVSTTSPAEQFGIAPPSTNVYGTVQDGPTPLPPDMPLPTDTPLPLPADATPGCVVYSSIGTNDLCVNIAGCSVGSSNAGCDAAAKTGNNTCVCVAKDTCKAGPNVKNVGDVTISGVTTATGDTSFPLTNINNAYVVDTTKIDLVYPGFDANHPITVSATGGDYGPFEISAPGMEPLTLTLTTDKYNLLEDTSSTDPGRYQALTVGWTAPNSPSAASINVNLNISVHGGTVGYLRCDVEDSGSLTISAGQISQLAALGHIGGFPELAIKRHLSGSTVIAPGRVELQVTSSVERYVNIEGYVSCESTQDCSSGQFCNTANKLCQAS